MTLSSASRHILAGVSLFALLTAPSVVWAGSNGKHDGGNHAKSHQSSKQGKHKHQKTQSYQAKKQPAAPSHKHQSAQGKSPHLAAPATSNTKAAHQSQGNSEIAHQHVIICHRTGSASNPYVVINISLSAWHEGHATHPPKSGRSDILLKGPEGVSPGDKQGFTKAACEQKTTTPTTPVTQTTPPGQGGGSTVITKSVSETFHSLVHATVPTAEAAPAAPLGQGGGPLAPSGVDLLVLSLIVAAGVMLLKFLHARFPRAS
jgi:hypothetical protein